MSELWLKFKDVDGSEKRVRVDGQKFMIGRHSSSDLSIADSRLSREHLKIERLGDLFVAIDCGSSNGSKVNGTDLGSPLELKDGYVLDLGGLRIQVEMEEAGARHESNLGVSESPVDDQSGGVVTPGPGASPQPAASSVPTSIFFIAPVLGVLVLSLLGGLIYFTSGKKQRTIAADEFQYSADDSDERPAKNNEKKEFDSPATPNRSPANDTLAAGTETSLEMPAANTGNSESEAIEQNGTAFLRKAAQNDPKAFLTGEQAKKVAARIKQFRGSTALAANISSARQNVPQIRSLAESTNLKPQFLAVAAINKLGSSRGDVAKTAQSMTATLEKLRTQIGSELAEDVLLMIAAYDQGEAGDFMKMRNMLQDLSNKFPDSSRSIRTIWFLQQNGKITQAEFDNAVTFLAIGTIVQNPKAFGVNAEAITF